MSEIGVIVGKEWRNFAGSERGVFVVYGALVLAWSLLVRNNILNSSMLFTGMWWLSLSVLISSTVANSVFVTERISGSMEILLTCGFSRSAVLYGKVLFVVFVSVALGAVCSGLALVWSIGDNPALFLRGILANADLYCGGAFLSATAGAWLSIRFSSPRIIPFVVLILVSGVCGAYLAVAQFTALPEWALFLLTLAVGAGFLSLARKDFHGEKIIAPLDI